MTRNEMKELDKWVGKNVMGLDYSRFNSTTDSAAAMAVFKLCSQKVPVVTRKQEGGQWCVWVAQVCDEAFDPDLCGTADTLEVAICLFSKQLFSQ